MFDGMPPARCGNLFIAIHHDNSRGSEWRTALMEIFGVWITVTLRCTQPFDRWVKHKDELEKHTNAIRDVVARDCFDYSISQLADKLSGLAPPGEFNINKEVSYVEGLAWEGNDPLQEVGPEWFNAGVEGGGGKVECGLTQRMRFGGNKRVRRFQNVGV
jgi:hypothetical protein